MDESMYSGPERRLPLSPALQDCNCGALREVSAELRGEIALVVQDIKNMRKHFEEAHLTVKECVVELQAGNTALRVGGERFKGIEDDLDEHKLGKLGQHKVIDNRFKILSIGLGVSLGTWILTDHAQNVWKVFKEIL